eukprot:6343662-Alexandrium_andersonii.AAC.1
MEGDLKKWEECDSVPDNVKELYVNNINGHRAELRGLRQNIEHALEGNLSEDDATQLVERAQDLVDRARRELTTLTTVRKSYDKKAS